jgi:hypothetical protein
VLGPTIGGLLGASGDYYLGAKLAVAGSLLSVLLSLLMPNGGPNGRVSSEDDLDTVGADADKEKDKKEERVIPSTWAVVGAVWLFLSTKVITSVANAMASAAFPLILKNNYGMDEKQLGFSMSSMSACNAVVNGLFLAPIVRMVGGELKTVITYCILAMAALFALQAVVSTPAALAFSPALSGGMYEYLGLSFLLSIFQYVLSTTITGESTARVGPDGKGTLLGLEHSLFSLARVGAPQAGVMLLKTGGVSAVSAACAFVFTAVYGLWTCFKDQKVVTIKGQSEEERKGR